MINKLVEIGGKKRPVNFGRNFWGEVEQLTGKKTLQLLRIEELTGIFNQTAIAFAALKWGIYDPEKGMEPLIDFTKANVGDWLDERPEAMTEISNLLLDAMPTSKKKEIVES